MLMCGKYTVIAQKIQGLSDWFLTVLAKNYKKGNPYFQNKKNSTFSLARPMQVVKVL